MKQTIVKAILCLGLVASANASMCEEAIDDTPLYGTTLQSISTVAIKQTTPVACLERDGSRYSFLTTMGLSFTSLAISHDSNEMGIDY